MCMSVVYSLLESWKIYTANVKNKKQQLQEQIFSNKNVMSVQYAGRLLKVLNIWRWDSNIFNLYNILWIV